MKCLIEQGLDTCHKAAGVFVTYISYFKVILFLTKIMMY